MKCTIQHEQGYLSLALCELRFVHQVRVREEPRTKFETKILRFEQEIPAVENST